jgi:hypothetical protein
LFVESLLTNCRTLSIAAFLLVVTKSWRCLSLVEESSELLQVILDGLFVLDWCRAKLRWRLSRVVVWSCCLVQVSARDQACGILVSVYRGRLLFSVLV